MEKNDRNCLSEPIHDTLPHILGTFMIPTDRADAFNIPTDLPRTARLENWNIQAQSLCDEQLFANKLVDEETPPIKKFENKK